MLFALSALLALIQALPPVDQGIAAYTKREYAQARDVLRPLADAGEARAQYYIGLMYQQGVGYPRNFVQAHLWFNLSAARGVALAATARDEIEKVMTQQQRAEAEGLALEWRPLSGGVRPPAPTTAPAPEIRTPSRGPLAKADVPTSDGAPSMPPASERDAIEELVDFLSSHVRAEDSRHSEAEFDVIDCVLTSEEEYYVSSRTTVTVIASLLLSNVDRAREFRSDRDVTIFAKNSSDVLHERSSGSSRRSSVFTIHVGTSFDFDRFNGLLKAAVAQCSR